MSDLNPPKMILFDYGQTLAAEQKFDGVKGTEAVLQYATKNKYHLSAQQVQAKANEINQELGRFEPGKKHLLEIEVPNIMFCPYLYESQGIEIGLSSSEIDTVFWNAASPGAPTEGIEDFLEYLKKKRHPHRRDQQYNLCSVSGCGAYQQIAPGQRL